MKKEGQPSGLNPEWEANKEQNTATAKRIDALLLGYPDPTESAMKKIIEKVEESGHSTEDLIESIAPLIEFSDLFPGVESIKSMDDMALWIAEEKLTVGYDTVFHHADNRRRYII